MIIKKKTFFNPVQDSLLNISIVNGMIEDENNEMWLSTKGNGIYKLNYNGEIVRHLTTEHGLSSNMTNSITLDPNGMLWFATPEGIHYLKPGSAEVETVRLDIEGSMSEFWVQMQFDDHIF